MNWVRTKKKAKEVAEPPARASTDSEVPSIHPIKKVRTFGRTKKPEPEPAPAPLDVANALPSSDDFRTSLLMSGLSARFSMLREQDDPNSKIGKASDDSVLFPKQKFNDFSFQSPYGLSDIAEVSSIHGSRKLSYAKERKDSYSTLNGDDDGSIMNRSKPGEGNNLFGGRQKIYKIPGKSTASTKSLGESGGMGGRALYDHDVSQSQFQKLREKEREEERERAEKERREESEAQASRPPSPQLSGYNRNRETTSTTSSTGPSNARISTAATSITSQRTPSLSGSHGPNTPGGSTNNGNLERSATKTRRLYETGLDQHLHEQQHSAMSRIDTLSKRTMGSGNSPMNSPTGPLSPTGTAHLIDRGDKHALGGKGSMPDMRTTSPPPNAALGKFDFAVKSIDHPDSKSYGVASPPLSPSMMEQDDIVVLPVQPNDRGKATATGAFQRPSHAYDEGKYSQRQVQMQQGRDVPPTRKHSPPSAFVPRQPPRSRAGSNATFASAASGNSGRSRSSSSAQRQFFPPGPSSGPLSMVHTKIPEDADAAGTFLNSPDESTISSPEEVPLKPKTSAVDLTKMNFHDRNINLERPPESQHPANRTMNAESTGSVPGSSPGLLTPDFAKSAALPADSPTLGPTATMSGLSGMVRQHMRVDSNSSSVYGGASPYGDGPSTGPLSSRFPIDPMGPMPQNIYNSTSNPWDHDDTWDQGFYGDSQGTEPQIPMKKETQPISPPGLRPSHTKTTEEGREASWERELKSHHTRDGSTETQKERLDFKNDLAERRRRVQENLKSFVETDSRSSSPVAEHREPLPSKSNPLGLLRAKTSRGTLSVKVKDAPPSKSMKMLGIGSATMTSSPSPNRQNFDAEAHRRHDGEPVANGPSMTEEGQMAGGQKGKFVPPQAKAFRQARRDAQRERERQITMRHNQGNERDVHHSEWSSTVPEHRPQREAYNQRVPPNIKTSRPYPPARGDMSAPLQMPTRQRPMGQESQNNMDSKRSESSPRPSRDRSTSDISGPRSKSRNGKFKDDMGGLSTPSHGHLAPKSPGTPGTMAGHSPVPSPMMPSPIGPSPMLTPGGRSRSNSRAGPGPGSYFEPQKLQPMKTEGFVGLPLSPRPSPTAPFVLNATPVQPSPGNSAVNTPVTPAFQNQRQQPGARKRSISKHQISEPTFVSSTSRVTTVNLPPEASLSNGMEASAPPIPPVNPMRRQTRGMFGLRKKEDLDDVHSLPAATQSTEEMSTFSDDGDDKPSKPRQKLRKISSEGGGLSAKARQAAPAIPTAAMPSNYAESRNNSPPRPSPATEGTMF
ncbi:hypothetical protein HYFRA_00011566 [Hymenoscyphus fraxineus]|uniref:Uncharacterized protein n=1 Tax=Hymenoscyphus fraxineus TaxID=746836 RepID=A0A9N9L602_9HELO|nr:hypothetical protein HYFRA_00011566 [Hymenoscyphus fraxineus]